MVNTVIQNYAQIRAKNALNAAKRWNFFGADGSECMVKRIPNMIIENGLLGMMTFAMSKCKSESKKDGKKGDTGEEWSKFLTSRPGIECREDDAKNGKGFAELLWALYEHLVAIKDPLLVNRLGVQASNPVEWLKKLVGSDSDELRFETAECMAYLAYLRRFAGISCGGQTHEQ